VLDSPILVVEDDLDVQATVARILEDSGYKVVDATDGIEALATLDGLMPALILLDLTMPRMDGWAFATELDRIGIRTQIPVVVMTADGRAQEKATQLGADDYIQKPFDVDRLLEIVTRLVQRPT
jgi:CheY-like chemotaxis protein